MCSAADLAIRIRLHGGGDQCFGHFRFLLDKGGDGGGAGEAFHRDLAAVGIGDDIEEFMQRLVAIVRIDDLEDLGRGLLASFVCSVL